MKPCLTNPRSFGIGMLMILGLAGMISASAKANASSLEADFRNPPMATRPYVWWHWMGSNFSKEGITKDLESMKASGIGGATIFNLSSAVQESHAPTENNPWPDQTYRSLKYWEAIKHAAAEADRLGVEVGLHNTVGYSTTGGPWIDEARSMQRLVWSSTEVDGGAPVVIKLPVPPLVADEGWGRTGRKISLFRDIAVLAVPAGQATIKVQEVLDLSGRLSTEGELHWEAPAGKWTVYRLGHASTGRPPHPVPDDVLGKVLEADKMSREQTRYHWENVINPLKEHLGSLLGKSLCHFLVDSYEAGNQNWTPTFREDFRKRKGYDPLPWLVTLGATIKNGNGKSARTVGTPEETARFEWDYRDMIATLFYENGFMPASEMIHAAGAKLQWEPYGGQFDTVAGAALADLPMGEFWTSSKGNINRNIIAAGQAAGRKVIGAEAFTGRPEISQWTETPAMLKLSADGAFGIGVNRLILHHWVHQPFDDRIKPGMGMGWWGTHFGRHQTWAELGKEFFGYLGRVQALLQRGETPADYVSVGAATESGDAVPQRAFLGGLRVERGKILLPSGRRYAFIHVPHSGALQPEMVRQIKTLLTAGATVVAAKPTHSPSLENYPACDDEVRALATELWGETQDAVRKVGPGTLYAKGDVATALRDLGITPIAQVITPKAGEIRIAPRSDGKAEWFFVANMNKKPVHFTASFRVQGLQPELWDAELGTIQPAPLWRVKNGRTEVDLALGSVKSVFIVFRHKTVVETDHLATIEAEGAWSLASNASGHPVISADASVSGTATFAYGKRVPFALQPAPAIPVSGPWAVELNPAVGAPGRIMLDALASLSTHSDPAVRYFSGTSTYRTMFKVDGAVLGNGQRLELDLGDVRDLVRVTVNGRDLGVIWHPPFKRDVTAALRSGENTLELAVANTWHNRLVGDEQFPADFEWGRDRGPKMGRALKGYPDWFLKKRPRPSGRQAFTIWYFHHKDTPLIPAGLLGPVQLKPVAEHVLQP